MTPLRRIAAFLDAQAAERAASENTVSGYARDLKDFTEWLDGRSTDLMTAMQGDIEGYLAHCEAQGFAKSTRARRLSAIKQFFRFAHEEGWRQDNPALRLKGPGRAKRLPKTLSEEEVSALLEAAQRTGRADDLVRNTCLMEVLYATGMRVSELVSLPVSAARGDPRLLLVKGKGGKERMVPLSPPARAALADWLALRDAREEEARAKGAPPSDVSLSISRKGRPSDAASLLPADQGTGDFRRDRPIQGYSAHLAACLRDASSGKRCGSEGDPDASGPCRCGDDRDLYPCS